MKKDFCEYCNAILPDEEKLVTVYRRGQHFIFERVPSRAVGEMERGMREPKSPSTLVSVPVIELQLAA